MLWLSSRDWDQLATRVFSLMYGIYSNIWVFYVKLNYEYIPSILFYVYSKETPT